MKNNWEYKPVSEIFDTVTDFVAAGSFADLRENVIYNNEQDFAQLIRTTDLKNNFSNSQFVYVNEHAFNYLWRVNLAEECIILPNIGNCGEVYYLHPSMLIYPNNVLGPNAIMVRSKKHNQKYLAFALKGKYFQRQLFQIVSQVAQSKFNKTNLKKLIVPVPSLEVQERIVAELDKINETIEDCRELLRNLDALAQSLFYDTFGDPVTNPKGWEIKKLDEICRAISTGITYKPDNVADIGTIVLRSSNIQNSSFVLDDIVHIDMSLKPSQYVQKNDILMCSRNGSARLVGKVALIPQLNEKMSWGAFMTIIRSDYYHYLLQFFRLPAFREQLTKTKTTTVNQITIGMLKKIQIPMPPLSLQEQFASRIEQIEAQKKAVEETIENLQTLLDSRMDYWFN